LFCFVSFWQRFEWQKPRINLGGGKQRKVMPNNHPPPPQQEIQQNTDKRSDSDCDSVGKYEVYATCDTARKTTYLTHNMQVQIFNFNSGSGLTPKSPTPLPPALPSPRHVRPNFSLCQQTKVWELNLQGFHEEELLGRIYKIIHSFFMAQGNAK